MTEYQENEPHDAETDRDKVFGWELLCFTAGFGLVLFGLIFAFTGFGALIGVAMMFIGGVVCLFGSAIAVLAEWRVSRHKES